MAMESLNNSLGNLSVSDEKFDHCYIDQLSDDIQTFIPSFLRLKSLLCLKAINKKFNKAVTKHLSLVRRLSLHLSEIPLGEKCNEKLYEYLASLIPNLRRLQVKCCKLRIPSEIEVITLISAFRNTPCWDFTTCSGGVEYVTTYVIHALSMYCSAILEEIDCFGMLKVTDTNDPVLSLTKCKKLRRVYLFHASDENLLTLVESCRELEMCHVGAFCDSHYSFETFGKICDLAQRFEVFALPFLPTSSVLKTLAPLKKIKSLFHFAYRAGHPPNENKGLTDGDLRDTVKNWPNLEHLRLCCTPQFGVFTQSGMEQMIESLDLRTLEITDWKTNQDDYDDEKNGIKSETVPRLDDHLLDVIAENSRGLVSLIIDNCDCSFSMEKIEKLVKACGRQIERLELPADCMTQQITNKIFRNCPNLVCFDDPFLTKMKTTEGLNYDVICSQVAQHCKYLYQIGLLGDTLTDGGVIKLVNNCRRIHRLCLRQVNITDGAFEEVLKKLGLLQELQISECPNLTEKCVELFEKYHPKHLTSFTVDEFFGGFRFRLADCLPHCRIKSERFLFENF